MIHSNANHGDAAALRRHTRFLEEVEMAIRGANQEIIGHTLPHLNRDAFIRLAVSVARLRADYMAAVLDMDWTAPGETAFTDLGRRRHMYEEARSGFEALRHAIEMGYAELSEDGDRP
jgi:hypothetical protein